MTIKKCSLCNFVGHWYQLRAHFDFVHVLRIPIVINVIQKHENNRYWSVIQLSFENDQKVELDFPRGPIAKIAKIVADGEWRNENEKVS